MQGTPKLTEELEVLHYMSHHPKYSPDLLHQLIEKSSYIMYLFQNPYVLLMFVASITGCARPSGFDARNQIEEFLLPFRCPFR